MTFITVQFDYDKRGKYHLLLKAFEKSVKKNCPGAKIKILKLKTPKKVRSNKGFTSNTIKMEAWLKAIDEIDDDQLVFIDCDTIVRKDLSSIWEKDFDVCYTKRTSPDTWIPFNAGVIFVKKNDRSRAFMKLWHDVNLKMYNDFSFHSPYREKYAGMNQASLGYILENPHLHDADILAVNCKNWNCCNEDWVEYYKTCKVLHIKGRLRNSCLGSVKTIPLLKEMVAEWRSYAS